MKYKLAINTIVKATKGGLHSPGSKRLVEKPGFNGFPESDLEVGWLGRSFQSTGAVTKKTL